MTIVYLRAQPETLRARLGAADANRPSLTGAGTLGEIDAVFAARDGLYRELATEIIEIDRGTTIDAARRAAGRDRRRVARRQG
ncbi:MAG: hypothetical protein HND58_15340 [Planctomycetota bacterium]|nr:MAG: hypothetical protein HND58_15340 [Planctomycetota bacterium]